ncbi:MAG TPA: hypothetical protein VHT91_25280 [Kofleriaceae bacterium]|jgi:hypothetical protein|nr:hypothetical protein [Kofleriaceae bacterium]
MRALAVVFASSLIASGCAVNSYKIPPDELARLARVPPEARGEHVRVVQELVASEVPAAPPVTRETQVVIAPQFDVAVGVHGPRAGFGGGFGRGVNGKIGGLGKDGKSAAVAFLFAAATAMVTAAVIEGSRFDGWAQLHPMHPVHLIGHDGSYTVVPLAWLDPSAVAWTDTAVVRPAEGPWRELERAPLSRQGLAYGLFGGTGSLRSADGSLAMGPAWTVQLGYFATQQIGVLASAFFGWRDNRLDATLFETRYTAELQYLPLQLGILHGGLFGGAGVAYRFEDAAALPDGRIAGNDSATLALTGGAMFQLDINTRLALTLRLGLAQAHGEQMHDAIFGISVY